MTTDAPHDYAQARAAAREWAVRLKTGSSGRADVAAFWRWHAERPLNAQAWQEVARNWHRMAPLMQEFGARHPERVRRPAPRAPGRRLFLGAAISGAGALAIVGMVRPPLGLWPSWDELGADYRTAKGEQRELGLTDHLDVSLNTQTSISVAHAGAATRIALIAGEAAVSASQAPCDVLAGGARLHLSDGEIEVRRLNGDRVWVQCMQGSVEVRHPDRTVVLNAGQQVFYGKTRVDTPTQTAAAPGEWRQGKVVFRELPLAEAVEEINRYRPGRVVLLNQELGRQRFTATFDIGNLDDAIALLEAVHHVRVRRTGDLVFLS